MFSDFIPSFREVLLEGTFCKNFLTSCTNVAEALPVYYGRSEFICLVVNAQDPLVSTPQADWRPHSDPNAVPVAPQAETNNAHPAVVTLPAEVFLSLLLFPGLFLLI